MKKLLTAAATMLVCATAMGQGYEFTEVVTVPVTSVKNQASTGTCWCFATTSFIEAELLRQGKGEHDLSEMYTVRQKYMNQLNDNYLRRGRGNIGQGSVAHTMLNVWRKAGAVPEEAYTGINYESDRHNHGELTGFMSAIADVAVKQKKRSPEYDKLVESLFDIYLGEVPETFTYQGKQYTPKSFAESLGINPDDYVEITSFTHHPYYEQFELEIPDNWEHADYYNVPLDDLMAVIDNALNNGYTVAWDGDVSERGFSFKNGAAINPDVKDLSRYSAEDSTEMADMDEKARMEKVLKFDKPYPEIEVTPEVRQAGFDTFVTTDDHLMHLTGIAKDQNGTKYYRTKNSWGTERNKFGGYLNMSDSFVRAKTMSVMVHKDALPKDLRKKLGIK